ncbi:unnamed protein product, partial [Owenia fusiformis]
MSTQPKRARIQDEFSEQDETAEKKEKDGVSSLMEDFNIQDDEKQRTGQPDDSAPLDAAKGKERFLQRSQSRKEAKEKTKLTLNDTGETSNYMYKLGQKIAKFGKEKNSKQIKQQAKDMCALAEEYLKLTETSAEGWYFVKACCLFNAALRRYQKIQWDIKDQENTTGSQETYIKKRLQVIETEFLKKVPSNPKVSNMSTSESAIKFRSLINEVREYETNTINHIHENVMKIDLSGTADMSEDAEIQTIEESNIFYNTVTDKIKGFHNSVIEDCMKVLGVPQCRYAILGHGSLARKEATAWSDLEFSVLYDPTEKSPEHVEDIKAYFRVLAHYIHIKILNLAETLPYCL